MSNYFRFRNIHGKIVAARWRHMKSAERHVKLMCVHTNDYISYWNLVYM